MKIRSVFTVALLSALGLAVLLSEQFSRPLGLLAAMRQGLTGTLRLGAIPTALTAVSLLTAPFCQRHPHARVALRSLSSREIAHDLAEGWLAYWQPEDQPKGTTAVAIVLPKGAVKEFTNDDPGMPDSKKHANVPQPTHEGYPPIRTQLGVTQAEVGKPFSYYFGACWDRSGDFTNHVQWDDYIKRFAERRDQPLQVTVRK